MDEITRPWFEDASLPGMLRHARATYGGAMRKALEAAGYDDLPANGLYVIGALALDENMPLGKILAEMRMSKQAGGQLVDTLVMRGYLERSVDEEDRRKLNVMLTPRGQAAADTQGAARRQMDAELVARVGEEDVSRARRVLAALIEMGSGVESEGGE